MLTRSQINVDLECVTGKKIQYSYFFFRIEKNIDLSSVQFCIFTSPPTPTSIPVPSSFRYKLIER